MPPAIAPASEMRRRERPSGEKSGRDFGYAHFLYGGFYHHFAANSMPVVRSCISAMAVLLNPRSPVKISAWAAKKGDQESSTLDYLR
jgi:hypothetical protein